MCGIAALVASRAQIAPASVCAMCNAVRHRGPDGEGFAYFNDDGALRGNGPDTPTASRAIQSGIPARVSVALGHRRLAIIDPTPAGRQPMASRDGKLWITFNGEIYNFVELRNELTSAGHRFYTATDTEVILAAYREWGADCLRRFNGMFAFVLFDRGARSIFAARDRYGVKPLYLWRAPDGTIALASEIKQFTVLDGWKARLDGQRAYDYLNWGLTDHTSRTLFDGVTQLPPGTYVTFDTDQIPTEFVPTRWYRIGEGSTNGEDATQRWRDLFLDAVKLRLRADVPVGTALSGGIDSSSIVTAVAKLRREMHAAGEQNAFTARSHEASLDEGAYADIVARAARVTAHTAWPDADRLLDALPDLAWHMDEPFGSTSVFAEWSVFRTVATTSVKVTLDGHGADELLAGYTAFAGPYLADLMRRGRIGAFVREASALLRSGRYPVVNLAAAIGDEFMPQALRMKVRGMTGRTVSEPDWIDLRRLRVQPGDPFREGTDRGLREFSLAQMRATSLPMQLHWNDRNSMAHSVESRAPFLDYRLVDYTLALPDDKKLAGGNTKVVLREALSDLLPPEILARRDKVGFVTAERLWITCDRQEAFLALARKAIGRAGGIFPASALQRADDMIHGRRRYHESLWRIVSFGAWLERFDVAID